MTDLAIFCLVCACIVTVVSRRKLKLIWKVFFITLSVVLWIYGGAAAFAAHFNTHP